MVVYEPALHSRDIIDVVDVVDDQGLSDQVTAQSVMDRKNITDTVDELNNYIKSRLSEHSYAYYFTKKFVDFTGLHIAFFSGILIKSAS